ncbi:hypothetical protein [Rhodopila sp.]|uniref:hypothetical protein n=1 Tax=Rhodopila sp. TaxID=2480087 RepID=UPI002C4D2277|nr:hypothetical protein [Rhodopila sp.]HVZ07210.1 hypothetical protein [Rhodopila sp.]
MHKVIERMVPWEASNNEAILNEARWEIARSVAWGLGEEAAARIVSVMGPKAADARALAYRLFEIATQKGWAAEALVYNELAQEWPKLEELAAASQALPGSQSSLSQMELL